MFKPKQSRYKGNRKHYTQTQPSKPKRLPRQRKPETLQSFWRERLQPWLDLANLPSSDVDVLRSAFLDRFALVPKNTQPSIFWELAQRVRHFPGGLEELKRLFRTVRELLEGVPKMAWPPDEKPYNPSLVAASDIVPFQMEYEVGDHRRNGRISFAPDPLLEKFQKALEGAEIVRVKQCPISDCGNFFYAVRANTGACDQHLALSRVQRSRDPEARRRYEEAREINRLVRDGMALNKAKEELARKRRKRRKFQ